MLAAQTDFVRPPAHRETDLRRDNERLPLLALEPAADHLFGAPAPVGVRGVNEGAAGRDEAVEDGVAGHLVRLAPEGHRAEAEFAHFEACLAEIAILHAPLR